MRSPERPHVLVVDDESCVREALTAALSDRYIVHTAASGQDACAILRAHPVAAIVLDAILDGEHGLDLVERFRAIAPAPVLLLTGHGSEALAGRAVWAGVNGYLKKPPSLAELHAALARLIPRMDCPDDLAARARQYLDEHVTKPLRLANLAHQLAVSEMHLRRCFRLAYGKTPHQYLTQIRLVRAATLLRTTALCVERIALEVGFPNVPWFNKLFKEAFQMTPLAYRTGRTFPGTTGHVELSPPNS